MDISYVSYFSAKIVQFRQNTKEKSIFLLWDTTKKE